MAALRQSEGLIYNLVVEIENPGAADEENRQAAELLAPILQESGELTIQSVADTIFPAWEYVRHGPRGVYDVYPDEVYPAISDLPANRWGTYAYRLVRRKDDDGQEFVPLERLVEKLKVEAANPSPKRAVYELDADLAGLSTYDATRDWNNYMGGQCLSHVSVKLGPKKEVYLTALYRYQYFVRKALGNFLGLARLQDFIAREAGLVVGPLVCHATLARLDTGPSGGWGLGEIDRLVERFHSLAGVAR